METKLAYLDDVSVTEAKAWVVETGNNEFGEYLVLDSTIFYPQGGGQPCDQGTLSWENGLFEVNKVVFSNGLVYHYGNLSGLPTEQGAPVVARIDAERRGYNSKVHTAGHLVDVAMMNCGFDFPPTKGYHFPDSPYVEYAGVIEAEVRDEARARLNAELERLIQQGARVTSTIVDHKEELYDLCPFVPDYIAEDKPIRVVTVAQNIGCPCGGTHVTDISELGQVEVHKIKAKSGHTRVSYRL